MMNAQTSHGQILSFVLHATTIAFCASCPVAADSIWNQLFDPADGQFDVSGLPPPSTSVVPGAATENDSWLAGGGHQGIWRNDRIRYLGAAGYASINLKFYGLGEDTPLDDSPEQD